MQKLKQIIVTRNQYVNDEGDARYHDYVPEKEDFDQFVNRVTEACETVNGEFLGVSYPNEDVAVVMYRMND